MESIFTYMIGLLAQGFFSARILVQWIMSERAKKVVNPALFWVFSVAGSYLLFIYGWIRDDFAIMLGQVISYYIYIWNLKQKGILRRLHIIGKIALIGTPLLAFWSIATNWSSFIEQCFHNEDIPLYLLIYGSLGQVIFTLRFVYQFFYSKHKKESMLPAGFWIISLTGSAIIVSYGIFRLDPVIILGQSFGFVSYIRNLIISYRSNKTEKE